jgi:uncharacterized protein HemX
MTENLQSAVTKSATTLATTAPHWVCLILVVGGFLWYLDRKDQIDSNNQDRSDLVAIQRIDNCHSVQERSIVVMEDLTTIIARQDQTFQSLTELIRSHLIRDHGIVVPPGQ